MKPFTKILRLVLILALALGVYLLFTNGLGGRSVDIKKLQNLVESFGMWGVAVFVILSSIRPFLFIPSPVLFVLGGVLYGGLIGSILSLVGLLTGASLCRYFAGRFQKFFVRIIGKHHRDKLEELGGEKVVKKLFMMRVTPGFPFDPISYGAGLAGINYSQFLLGTALGSTPKVFLYTFLGDGIDEIFSIKTLAVFIILILLACLPLLLDKRPAEYLNHN
ncbi:TVP38/TMEM64 family protein [Alkaliphilus crotonatoxidans]|jgi:uncharacterized membrane protein YdjX (TVP38/TMEM64 family)